VAPDAAAAAALLPVLCGACPGWVCYAEKSAPAAAAAHAAAAPPPQAVAGAAVKRWLAASRGWAPASVFHVAVQPCPDKKLEAVRDEWADGGGGGGGDGDGDPPVPFVDCVLTTAELASWAASRAGDAGAAPPRPAFDALPAAASGAPPSAPMAVGAPGGSGGWAEAVFRGAADRLFGRAPPPGPLAWTPGRNPDTRTLELKVDGETVLSVGVAHGLRNIQTVVRRLGGGKGGGADQAPPSSSSSSSPLFSTLPHYVEMMASPRGCANGGGQGVEGPAGEGGLAATAAALDALAPADWWDRQLAAAGRAATAWPAEAGRRLRARVAVRGAAGDGADVAAPTAVPVSAVADW
jgi:hypothetical protein